MRGIVAIVGRPNVGKSTLFNRLIGEKKAIVDNISGVTRDRIYGVCEWLDNEFDIIDTGGYVSFSDDIFEREIRSQVEIALKEADVVIFLVDSKTGITDLDYQFAKLLRGKQKEVLLVVNKVDNHIDMSQSYEFYKLGFDKLFTIAAVSGSGTGELLEEVVKILTEKDIELKDSHEKDIPKVAIVGRPNVGKSTFVNSLLGEARNIVSEISGTTRDSINSYYNKFGKEFYIIDTAGLRKKNKEKDNIEFYSNMRAVRTVNDADVVILMIDANNKKMESQDLSIMNMILKRRKGLVIAVNKWDQTEKETNSMKDLKNDILKKTAPFTDIPIIFTSATQKVRLMKTIEEILQVYKNRRQKISTSKLNDYMLEVISAKHPPSVKGKFIRIKYVTQLSHNPPSIGFFCNLPQYVKEDYKRYLENKLREKFNFTGVPLALSFKKK